MADNPNKKGLDAKRVSQQPHEQAYQKRKRKEAEEGGSEKTSGRGSSSSDRTGSSDKGSSSGRGSSRSK